MAKPTGTFVVCGEALWDLFAVERGAALAFDARPGGSPFNVAVGLARLGQPVAFFGGLSADPLGDRLFAVLAREGVRTDLLRRADRPTTLSVVSLAPDGRPAYAFYGEGAADRAIEAADLPSLDAVVWGAHAGSYALVVEPIGSTLLTLFAREAGRRLLTLDPNVRLVVEPDRALWRTRLAAFAAHADVVKASDEDLELLYPGEAPEAVARRWLEAGAGLVVVTCGADGAEAFGPWGRLALPAPQVALADTVGAGDAFQAALIAGLAERDVRTRVALGALDADTVATLVAFAIEAASIACTRRGADPPHRVELSAPRTERP